MDKCVASECIQRCRESCRGGVPARCEAIDWFRDGNWIGAWSQCIDDWVGSRWKDRWNRFDRDEGIRNVRIDRHRHPPPAQHHQKQGVTTFFTF